MVYPFFASRHGYPGRAGHRPRLDGKIVFYDQETLNGNAIWVRFSIWKTGEDTAQSEQAFSNDAGRNWEVNWVNKYTRIR
jgi:hypothetical protein